MYLDDLEEYGEPEFELDEQGNPIPYLDTDGTMMQYKDDKGRKLPCIEYDSRDWIEEIGK